MALSNALPNSILKPGVCTSTTRPSNPYEGQFIYETDTNALLVYDGSSWVIPSGPVANPTLPYQFANKNYVDNAVATKPTVNTGSNWIVKATDQVVLTDFIGQADVYFATPFPNFCETVVATNGDANVPTQFITIVEKTTAKFTIRAFTQEVVNSAFAPFEPVIARTPVDQNVRVSYIAVGY